ncbi:hypothetical protein BGX29_011544 [Mortierella sp. GBA35]|nr:hypothetical protein BGX29_011544 [Mortierella sp. GBA35]
MTGITYLPKEVLVLIGDFVTKPDLIATFSTCRPLQHTLSHLLWRDVRIESQKPQPSIEILKVHAHVVHHFEVCGCNVSKEFFKITFPHLRTLTIRWYSPQDPARDAAIMATQDICTHRMIQFHPTIRELVFYPWGPASSTKLWDTIVTTLQQPRRLEIGGAFSLGGESLAGSWRVCTKFEEICIKGISTGFSINSSFCYSPVLNQLDFGRVKRLYMDWQSLVRGNCPAYHVQLNCIKLFTNLTTLYWNVGRYDFPVEGFASALQNGAWPHLQDLVVTGIRGGAVAADSDEGLTKVIQKLPPSLRRL